MLANNEELSYSRRDEWNFCIDGTEIYSSHYKNLDEYKDTMTRRKDRLIEYIKGVDKLLFMRQIVDNGVSVFPTAEDIEELKGYIYKIKPNCNFNILFVVYTDKKLELPDGVKYLFLRNSEKENMKLWVDKINEF